LTKPANFTQTRDKSRKFCPRNSEVYGTIKHETHVHMAQTQNFTL